MKSKANMEAREITEMVPAGRSRTGYCSYCGKEQRIIHIMKSSVSGTEALVCFPCSRNGFSWLLANYPGTTAKADIESS